MADDKQRSHERDDEPGRTMVALFASHEEGREAMKALRKAHYGHLWFGVTSLAAKADGDTAVTVETGGFFSQTQSLVDALVHRGVDGEEARHLMSEIDTGNSIVTVEPKDKPVAEAVEIIEKFGGRLGSLVTAGSAVLRPAANPLLVGASTSDLADWEEEIFYRR